MANRFLSVASLQSIDFDQPVDLSTFNYWDKGPAHEGKPVSKHAEPSQPAPPSERISQPTTNYQHWRRYESTGSSGFPGGSSSGGDPTHASAPGRPAIKPWSPDVAAGSQPVAPPSATPALASGNMRTPGLYSSGEIPQVMRVPGSTEATRPTSYMDQAPARMSSYPSPPPPNAAARPSPMPGPQGINGAGPAPRADPVMEGIPRPMQTPPHGVGNANPAPDGAQAPGPARETRPYHSPTYPHNPAMNQVPGSTTSPSVRDSMSMSSGPPPHRSSISGGVPAPGQQVR